ncbi:MAG: hypothetical protein QXQ60_08270 [Thermofilum sp.]
MEALAQPVLVQCKRCDYRWYTRSRRVYVTCPNCMTKVRNPHVPMPPRVREREKQAEGVTG